jgi:hypothetical protein
MALPPDQSGLWSGVSPTPARPAPQRPAAPPQRLSNTWADPTAQGHRARPELNAASAMQYRQDHAVIQRAMTNKAPLPNQWQNRSPFDQTQPGTAEQFFSATGNQYLNPGQGEQWWQQNQNQFGAPGQSEQFFTQALGDYQGRGPNSNFAQDAYKDFAAGSSPSLDPYYDNAKRKLGEDLNQQFAARGAYGSSVALDRISEGMTDLNAAQANREADYALQRYGLGGQLAGGADSSGRANSATDLSWMSGVGSLAQGAQGSELARLGQGGNYALGVDQATLARLGQGQDAAGLAQEARRGRTQDYFGNLMGAYSGLAGMADSTYDSLIADDQASLDAQLSLQAGVGASGANAANRREDMTRQDIAGATNTFIAGYNAFKDEGKK